MTNAIGTLRLKSMKRLLREILNSMLIILGIFSACMGLAPLIQSNSVMGWPVVRIGIGRPALVRYDVATSMPKRE